MRKERKHYSAEEKVAILRRHLLDQVPVSDLCEELGLRPTVFYRWQKEFFGKRMGNRILEWRWIWWISDAAQPRPQGSVRRRAESERQPSRAARRGDNRGLGS